jgi:hypothetical protein
MNDFDIAVGRLAAQLPSCWRTDFKLDVARANVTANALREVDQGARQFALDSLPRGGDQQMPPNSAGAMPASLSPNNYTGGHHYRRRAGADQNGYSPEQVINFVARCLHECDDQQHAELTQGLVNLLDAEMGTTPATDQESGSTLRLPIGAGTAPADLISPQQSTSGSFGGLRESWEGIASPPSATDRRPMAPRERRLGHDQRQAQDAAIRQRHEAMASFASLFPDAMRISIWTR